jgi:hypothetical protein
VTCYRYDLALTDVLCIVIGMQRIGKINDLSLKEFVARLTRRWDFQPDVCGTEGTVFAFLRGLMSVYFGGRGGPQLIASH